MEQRTPAPDPRLSPLFPPGRTDSMEHALVHDERGVFCTCGFRPIIAPTGLWVAKTEILHHITDAKLAARGEARGGPEGGG